MDMANDAAQRAGEVEQLTMRGSEWIAAHADRMQQDPKALEREFRRYARRARGLREAARRPMCVAVFGASQAGKSYLVSRLAAPKGRPLVTQFGDQKIDFLRQINPEGGEESTGLVTRFTLRTPAGPADYPVMLELLSQTDIFKIFANTFLEDFDFDDFGQDHAALEEEFSRIAKTASATPGSGLTSDEIEDLIEYFDLHFRSHPLIQSLNGIGFWQRVADLGPRLSSNERVALFAPLWGSTRRFTEVCQELILQLQALGFPEIAYCGIDALVPRETSIIDVRMLYGLGDAGGESVIENAGRQGAADRPRTAGGNSGGGHGAAERAAVAFFKSYGSPRFSRSAGARGDPRH